MTKLFTGQYGEAAELLAPKKHKISLFRNITLILDNDDLRKKK